jgi:hypothetical protein
MADITYSFNVLKNTRLPDYAQRWVAAKCVAISSTATSRRHHASEIGNRPLIASNCQSPMTAAKGRTNFSPRAGA